jgi:cellobiose-specific phosphotransferase system component IIC
MKVLNLGLEHLGLIFIVNVTMELLKRRGLNTDYAPYVAIALGCLLVVPLMIWQGRTIGTYVILGATMLIEGAVVGMIAMGGYDFVKKLAGR